MDGTSDGCHQTPGCVRPIARTQRVGELLQTDLPNFREPSFAHIPISLDIGTNERGLYIAVKSDANSCMMSQEWIVARIQPNASVFNSGISYCEGLSNGGERGQESDGPYQRLGRRTLRRR
jgi:hypothetical protein